MDNVSELLGILDKDIEEAIDCLSRILNKSDTTNYKQCYLIELEQALMKLLEIKRVIRKWT